MANVPISICLLSELDPIIQLIQLALVKSSNKLSSFLTLTILWPLISKFSDSRWSKKSLTRGYTCKLRCQILPLKGTYDLPFSQYTPKDLESEAEGLGINLSIWLSHSRSFMGELFACWCCHMDPKGRSLELLDFTCSDLGNKQDSRLSYQNDKQHPSEGSSTLI